jgi:hypothetical protein
MPAEKFEMWKKKATAKPKPKPHLFDEDLDAYYIKIN